MQTSINYLTACGKVLYDKTTDYVSYYAGYNQDNVSDNENNVNNEDKIHDYDTLLKIDLYQDENKSKRIYPPSGYYNEYSTFINEPTYVIDNIYLGSAFNAASYETLKKLNIKIIINATTEIRNYFPDEFIYLRYKLYDDNKNSIKKYLAKSFADITHQQKHTQGNILIHCFMGASRSASLVIYYLMNTKRQANGNFFTFDEAVNFLRDKRIIVNPTFRLTKDLASSIMVKKINK